MVVIVVIIVPHSSIPYEPKVGSTRAEECQSPAICGLCVCAHMHVIHYHVMIELILVAKCMEYMHSRTQM